MTVHYNLWSEPAYGGETASCGWKIEGLPQATLDRLGPLPQDVYVDQGEVCCWLAGSFFGLADHLLMETNQLITKAHGEAIPELHEVLQKRQEASFHNNQGILRLVTPHFRELLGAP